MSTLFCLRRFSFNGALVLFVCLFVCFSRTGLLAGSLLPPEVAGCGTVSNGRVLCENEAGDINVIICMPQIHAHAHMVCDQPLAAASNRSWMGVCVTHT